MKTFAYYFKKIREMSVSDVCENVSYLILKPFFGKIQNLIDNYFSPLNEYVYEKKELVPLFDKVLIAGLSQEKFYDKNLSKVCNHYLNHEFDLLGSGWKRNAFVDNADGLFGYKYEELILNRDDEEHWLSVVLKKIDAKVAKNIYTHISKDYIPIDWQKDIKTGYRWSAKNWYRPIKYIDAEKTPGIDIKMPWELSRLQHLTRMAFLYAFGELDDLEKQNFVNEYENQLLDFIAQNPVRKGVNWYCTMDVGIRTANIALSYSLFKYAGAQFSQYFKYRIYASIKSHCNFIRKNLEWSSTCRSNHYLADVCGLLFGAAVLRDSKIKQNWFLFARNEIEKEILLQFHEDGSNFEASVAYHRLSSEMAVYAGALIEKMSNDGYCSGLTTECLQRIYKMGCFMKDVVLPDGTFYQCGDNDSGRFFNITPIGSLTTVADVKAKYKNLENYNCRSGYESEEYFDEEMNCPDALLAAINNLLGCSIETEHRCYAEEVLMKLLLPNEINKKIDFKIINEKASISCVPKNFQSNLQYKQNSKIQFGNKIKGTVAYKEYHYFGLSVFKSDNLFLGICWSDNGQNGNAGHTHNDKLSFELWIDGKPITRDPGTFVYTAFPQWRNEFRSVKNHNTICSNIEQNNYITLFSMQNNTKCGILERKESVLCLYLIFDNIMMKRKFELKDDFLAVEDESSIPFSVDFTQKYLSVGYGKLLMWG